MSATLNTTNIKHASSSSNNIVLASDGSTTISNLSNAGKILQLKSATKTDTASVTDNATPQDISGLSLTLTPASASSKFYITGKVQMSLEYAAVGSIHINVNGTVVGDAASDGNRLLGHSGVGYMGSGQQYSSYAMAFDFLVNASNANPHTIKIQMSQKSVGWNRSLYINRSQTDPNSDAGPRYTSTLTVMEVGA